MLKDYILGGIHDMKRMMLLLLVICLCMPIQVVFAHSKLTEATPAVDAKIQQSPQLIEMKFNTNIATISTFTLSNDAGEQIELTDISVEDDVLAGKPVNELKNGVYKVDWTIVGADGHTVTGNYMFTVDAPSDKATSELSTTVETDAEGGSQEDSSIHNESNSELAEATVSDKIVSTTDTSESTDEASKEVNEEKNQNIVPYVVIAVIIVGAIAIAIRKRK